VNNGVENIGPVWRGGLWMGLVKGGFEELTDGGEPKDRWHMDFITNTRSMTQMFNISYGK
jgi:hypothetical protein